VASDLSTRMSQAGIAPESSLSRRHLRDRTRQPVGCLMSRLLVIMATLKSILIAASVELGQGHMLSVILASILFNLAKLVAKRLARQTAPQDITAVSPIESRDRDDCGRNKARPSARSSDCQQRRMRRSTRWHRLIADFRSVASETGTALPSASARNRGLPTQ